ncbi:Uncharacterised protein [Mycobacterium tuberculosis]|nr:Uncharacterised protein [Mycobacterium tuberculosis]
MSVFLKFIFNTTNQFTGLLFDAVALSLILIVGVQQIRKICKRLSHLICKRNWTEGSLSQAWLGFLIEKISESGKFFTNQYPFQFICRIASQTLKEALKIFCC